MRLLNHFQGTIHTLSWAVDPPSGCLTHPTLNMTRPRESCEDQPEADPPLGPSFRQPVTGVLVSRDRSPRGDKEPATFWTRQVIQECNPPGSFNETVDKDTVGRKSFMRFASPEAFFRFTAIKPVWNYYEVCWKTPQYDCTLTLSTIRTVRKMTTNWTNSYDWFSNTHVPNGASLKPLIWKR